MNLFTNDDVIMCQVFLMNLRGSTLHWYIRLPRNSIDSFMTLIVHFGAQYMMSKAHHLPIVALTNIQQDEDESLHKFMERFSSVSV